MFPTSRIYGPLFGRSSISFRLSAEQCEARTTRRRAICDDGRHRQLHLGTHAHLAPNSQPSADLPSTFLDSWQSPVSCSSTRFENLGVDAPAIIPNPQAEQAIIVSNFSFNLTGVCVLERVSQHFARNPVYVVRRSGRKARTDPSTVTRNLTGSGFLS